jgi:hypothetical protein
MKSAYERYTYTPKFIVTMFTIAKIQNQSRFPSTCDWLKKNVCPYAHTDTHNGVLFTPKGELNLVICSRVYAAKRKGRREGRRENKNKKIKGNVQVEVLLGIRKGQGKEEHM